MAVCTVQTAAAVTLMMKANPLASQPNLEDMQSIRFE